ncbi:hypothetical protein GCM10023170_076240 [Phytohabitans houttuyneae]|uniref:Uncharacterized protein n=1 Tax=Phytohabitans houttuyneae TaxID=1076126 RepID=A0A6V8KKY6_9ACTN|nr:hypothetical protein Phou_070090 [Phytohabitans houttuyneae]
MLWRGGRSPPILAASEKREVRMSRRARTWLLAVLTAATTGTAVLLATAAQAGIQGSG